MSILITGIFMFALGGVAVALGGPTGFMALIAGFTLAWWTAGRRQESE